MCRLWSVRARDPGVGAGVIPSWADRVEQWSHPPVDDIGYFESERLLEWSDMRLRHLIERAERNRYGGWRNYQGRWRRILFDLKTTRGMKVLDYGCGIGLEALQYAKGGNAVWLADISQPNIALAQKVLGLYGYEAERTIWIVDEDVVYLGWPCDVIHCSGVLHHIPDPFPVMENFHRWLITGGEVRLMLYSDHAWRIATKTEPPESVEDHPLFEKYWQRWDPHGGYADWYDRDRLEQRFGDLFEIKTCEYLTKQKEYLGAVLVKI